ncbi:LytR family transcriptional regulator [Pseudoflavonifractor sp. AF19-9AC]|uniref:LCP family protein n=1 Tax=Pseudoflavonifractor sp. AF19-9AC TaxID=2292244 RepID=UPI000E49AD5A|nr:LCP family protein [Pseudoflavonifractor sp. AF19-9AC]RHR10690.1 LytR family transcriptional regulator [Pseudoflavonifractor sp. AF19-9AC]
MNVHRREGRAPQRAPQRRPQPDHRPKAAKKVRKRSGPKAVFWAFYKFLVVVSALIVVVYVGASALIRPPEIPQTGNQGGQTGPAVNVDDSQEVQGRQRREGVYNFVLLGKDVGSGNTDSITVVSYDVPNKKVGMISIPRDTAVERTWRSNPKINGAFYGAGPDVLKEEIEHTFGIPIDYYILVDLNGFVALVDELGGVEVNIPLDMNYDDPYQNLHIHFKKGTQTLSGQEAMEVVRYRHDNESSPNYHANQWYSDVQRGEMQRQVLTQLAKKVVSWNSVPKVMSFLDIFNKYVKTDLSATDMAYFATQALQVDMATGVTQGTLEGDGNATCKGYRYCFVYEAEDILPVLNEQVNPYNEPLTAEDLHLMVPD